MSNKGIKGNYRRFCATAVLINGRLNTSQTHLKLIKVVFNISIPQYCGMVKIDSFARPETVYAIR